MDKFKKTYREPRVCNDCGENESDCECWHGGVFD